MTRGARACALPPGPAPDMVTKMLALLGSFIIGSLGWWIGMKVGLMTAVILSGIGTGVGIWLGRKIASDYDLP